MMAVMVFQEFNEIQKIGGIESPVFEPAHLFQRFGIMMQAEIIGQSVDYLARKYRQAEEGYDNKSRMIFSVSVLTGVFLIILLL